jgi:hypothetical protein
VRLLTWSDPYLRAWLGAVRGQLLAEADYLAAALPGNQPNATDQAREVMSGNKREILRGGYGVTSWAKV